MKFSKTTYWQSIRLYWHFVRKHLWLAVAILFMTPLSSFVFRFLPPIFIARVLDDISSQNFIKDDLFASFGPDIIGYIVTSVIGGIILWRITVVLVWQLEMRVIQDITNKIFEHLVDLDANFHANRFGGSLVSQTKSLPAPTFGCRTPWCSKLLEQSCL